MTPIAVFGYNRRDHLERLFASLRQCNGFDYGLVTVFVDGPKSDPAAVESVRDFVRSMPVRAVISEQNLGLRKSIFAGVSRMIEEHGRVIVLEDDLVLSPIALDYFNAALDRYAGDERVWSVSGYIPDVPELRNFPRALVLPYAHSWGWATWRRAWGRFQLDASPRDENLRSDSFARAFGLHGYHPHRDMLAYSKAGLIDSWYIHWLYTIFREGGRSIFPPRRVTDNFGLGAGTHGGRLNPFNLLVKRPPLLEKVPALEDADEIDSFAIDLLRRCWEARVQRNIARAGGLKRRAKRLLG